MNTNPLKIQITLDLELVPSARELSEEAVDTWSWALERQIERLDLVVKADVIDVDFSIEPDEVLHVPRREPEPDVLH